MQFIAELRCFSFIWSFHKCKCKFKCKPIFIMRPLLQLPCVKTWPRHWPCALMNSSLKCRHDESRYGMWPLPISHGHNLHFKSEFFMKDAGQRKLVLILPNGPNTPGERAQDKLSFSVDVIRTNDLLIDCQMFHHLWSLYYGGSIMYYTMITILLWYSVLI